MMKCKICKKDFVPNPHWRHNWGICSDCKIINARRIRAKYKKSEKGKLAELRWRKNPVKKEIDKKSQQKPRAKKLAVLRIKKYLEKHPEKYIEKLKKQKESKWWRTKKSKERNKINSKKYRKTDKGKIANKNGKIKRRSHLENAGKFTLEEWEYIKWLYNYRCATCQKKIKLTVDHIIPISKGGKNVFDNLQPLCKSCNSKKSNKI